MSSRSLRRLTVGLTALAVAATPALVGAPATASLARGDVAEATTQVFITRSHTVRMDTELRPGTRRFVVRSARDASLQIVKPRPGYTKRELVRDVRGLVRNHLPSLRRLERGIELVGGLASGAESQAVFWLDLEPGTYWALDVYDETPTPAEALTVRVTGRNTGLTVDRAPVIRAVGAAEWAPRPRAVPRAGRLTFRNDSTENHFLVLAKLRRGATMADFRAWLEAAMAGDEETPPPVDFAHSIDTGVVSPGREMTLRYRLPAGRYVMVCFWPDARTGMPHAFMGMYRGITLR